MTRNLRIGDRIRIASRTPFGKIGDILIVKHRLSEINNYHINEYGQECYYTGSGSDCGMKYELVSKKRVFVIP